jgi:hypothetical protein
MSQVQSTSSQHSYEASQTADVFTNSQAKTTSNMSEDIIIDSDENAGQLLNGNIEDIVNLEENLEHPPNIDPDFRMIKEVLYRSLSSLVDCVDDYANKFVCNAQPYLNAIDECCAESDNLMYNIREERQRNAQKIDELLAAIDSLRYCRYLFIIF